LGIITKFLLGDITLIMGQVPSFLGNFLQKEFPFSQPSCMVVNTCTKEGRRIVMEESCNFDRLALEELGAQTLDLLPEREEMVFTASTRRLVHTSQPRFAERERQLRHFRHRCHAAQQCNGLPSQAGCRYSVKCSPCCPIGGGVTRSSPLPDGVSEGEVAR
jgi:hypothetical protein